MSTEVLTAVATEITLFLDAMPCKPHSSTLQMQMAYQLYDTTSQKTASLKLTISYSSRPWRCLLRSVRFTK
jgi:hypothetical protein